MPFNKLDDSAAGKIRPRFKLKSPVDKDELMELIFSQAKEDKTIGLQKQGRSLRLSIPKHAQHTWSPVLTLSFDKEKNNTIIRGLIGPSEMVWQVIMLFYIAFSILGFFGSIFAMVKWQLNGTLGYLIILPITIIILFSIFFISKAGAVKAHTETLHLLRFLRKAVDSIECERID
jgi:hypothetical protein